MEAGDIPMNHSTGNILSQVTNWVDEQEVNNEKLGEVSNLIQHIKSRLAFIDRNSDVIRESISSGTRTEIPLIGGRYTVINRYVSGSSGTYPDQPQGRLPFRIYHLPRSTLDQGIWGKDLLKMRNSRMR